MAVAAGGFTFGASNVASTGAGLFGSKTTTATSSIPSFSFGSVGSTGISTFGANKLTASTAGGFSSFGLQSSAATSANTGFSFGLQSTTASTSSSLSTAPGTGLFGLSTTTTASTGFSLFGAKTTASTTGFGGLSLTTSAATTVASTTVAKPVENPKEALVPAEITTLVKELETYIKGEKDVKEEISKISTEGIATTREEISSLKQAIALIANSLQRDSVAVENLKLEVGQELKNAEIGQRIKDVSASLHHDLSAPMEYFQRLVYSFETRINIFRREIDELETFISSSISPNQFTPQDLSSVLKRLNDSFIGLASELQQVHESVKVIKEKYLQYRRVVYNDFSDPFASRKKFNDLSGKTSLVGPSPFPVVQGAGVMASAFKAEAKPSSIDFNNLTGLSSTFAKPAASGLTRSLSFGGSAAKSTSFGGLGTGFGGSSSLFSKTPATTQSTLFGGTAGTPFTLQKPPSGKRGKLF